MAVPWRQPEAHVLAELDVPGLWIGGALRAGNVPWVLGLPGWLCQGCTISSAGLGWPALPGSPVPLGQAAHLGNVSAAAEMPFPKADSTAAPTGQPGRLSCLGASSPSWCLSVCAVVRAQGSSLSLPLSLRHRRVHVQQRWLPARLCQHGGELRVPLQGGILPERQPAHLHPPLRRYRPPCRRQGHKPAHKCS